MTTKTLNSIKAFSKLLILFSAVFLFPGCEGYRSGEGIVKDKLTNLPLDSVYCDAVTGSNTMYTDSKSV
jgi:hypothetical protein